MRCIICRKSGVSKAKSVIDEEWYLCRKCNKSWVWSSRGRYFRKRNGKTRWNHEAQLVESLKEMAKSIGLSDSYVVTQVGFPDWAVSKRGGFLRFDAAIPRLKILVDYHGFQHYTPDNPFHASDSDYKIQRSNDELKKKLAKIHGWTYVVFSYREDVSSTALVTSRIRRQVNGR